MNSKAGKNHSTYEELKIPGGSSNLKAKKDLKQKESKETKQTKSRIS